MSPTESREEVKSSPSSNEGGKSAGHREAPRRGNNRSSKKIFFRRRRGCPLSIPGAPEISYKNPELLSKYISEGKRILPARITNVCSAKQRKLKKAIRMARILALLPFVFNKK